MVCDLFRLLGIAFSSPGRREYPLAMSYDSDDWAGGGGSGTGRRASERGPGR